MAFFDFLDLFGSKFSFNSFGKPKFHTLFGRLTSLLVYIKLITFISVFGLDFFNFANPRIVYERFEEKNYTNFFNKNITMMWRIEYDNSQMVNFQNFLYPLIR